MDRIGKARWIYGKHVVKACLENPTSRVHKLAVEDELNEFCNSANQKNIPIEIVPGSWFEEKFSGQVHQKVAAFIDDIRYLDLTEVMNEGRNVVILDLLTDPQNIGAIIRSAAVFNIGAVIVQDKGSPNLDNSVINKASSGATEIVPMIREVNLSRTIEQLKRNRYWCVSLTEQGSEPLNSIDLRGKIAIIIGGEGRGIRRLILEKSDFKAYIPNTNSNFSTLNAAQAATICMYELSKQAKRF